MPDGLAAAIQAATGMLQYDGTLELTEPECSGAAAPGQLLNLSGGRTEWATMAAQIQRVEEQIDRGHDADHGRAGEASRPRRPERAAEDEPAAAALVPADASGRRGEAKGNAAQVLGGEQQPRSDSVVRPSSSAATARTSRSSC